MLQHLPIITKTFVSCICNVKVDIDEMIGWMDGWMNGWMDGCMGGWFGGWVGG